MSKNSNANTYIKENAKYRFINMLSVLEDAMLTLAIDLWNNETSLVMYNDDEQNKK